MSVNRRQLSKLASVVDALYEDAMHSSVMKKQALEDVRAGYLTKIAKSEEEKDEHSSDDEHKWQGHKDDWEDGEDGEDGEDDMDPYPSDYDYDDGDGDGGSSGDHYSRHDHDEGFNDLLTEEEAELEEIHHRLEELGLDSRSQKRIMSEILKDLKRGKKMR